jgi:hypothetical protein
MGSFHAYAAQRSQGVKRLECKTGHSGVKVPHGMVLWHMENFTKRTYGDKERFMTRGRKKLSTAMVHVGIRRFLTAKAWIRSQGSPHGSRGGQSYIGERCFPLLIDLPMPVTTPPISQVHSYIMQGNECVHF